MKWYEWIIFVILFIVIPIFIIPQIESGVITKRKHCPGYDFSIVSYPLFIPMSFHVPNTWYIHVEGYGYAASGWICVSEEIYNNLKDGQHVKVKGTKICK